MFCEKVLLIRPAHFDFNEETSATNMFQKRVSLSKVQIRKQALKEFEDFVALLQKNNIITEIFNDISSTPDAVFPNNWFSLHENGMLILYPMLSVKRRKERRRKIIASVKEKYEIRQVIDLTYFENENRFLEGTGSLVFDWDNNIAYANISSRTNKEVAEYVCGLLHCKAIFFTAEDFSGNEIYHTNVMLSVCNGFAIVCLQSIKNSEERKQVKSSLNKSGKEIVEITFEQMNSFCANALQLKNSDGNFFLAMSENAFRAFTKQQLHQIKKHIEIIFSPLKMIETVGGGSARCMLAEIPNII